MLKLKRRWIWSFCELIDPDDEITDTLLHVLFFIVDFVSCDIKKLLFLNILSYADEYLIFLIVSGDTRNLKGEKIKPDCKDASTPSPSWTTTSPCSKAVRSTT